MSNFDTHAAGADRVNLAAKADLYEALTRMLHKSLARVLACPLDAGLFGPFGTCASSSQRVKVTRTSDRRHSRCRTHREGLCMRSTSR